MSFIPAFIPYRLFTWLIGAFFAGELDLIDEPDLTLLDRSGEDRFGIFGTLRGFGIGLGIGLKLGALDPLTCDAT